MNCEQIGELLPDYFQGGLSSQIKEVVEMHLAQCTECHDEVAVWKKLALLPVEQPSEESRMRFEAILHEHVETRRARNKSEVVRETRAAGWSFWQWLRTPAGAVAWSAALLVMGVLVGHFAISGGSSRPQNDEMAQMHNELTNMRQLVVLSMLQQQSASERLQGVSWSTGAEQLDPQVSSALLHTLRFDGSVDVRLAALEALSKHASQPQVRSGVLDALQGQQSPLVQVALIDQLVEWRDRDAVQHLRSFEQTPDLNPTVKQRAEWAVSKLN